MGDSFGLLGLYFFTPPLALLGAANPSSFSHRLDGHADLLKQFFATILKKVREVGEGLAGG
jgi:hypothetical protein